MKNYNFTTIYKRLKDAQYICNVSENLDGLFDLIQYNINSIYENWEEFQPKHKEQINNFSIEALKAAKAYKKALKNSLV